MKNRMLLISMAAFVGAVVGCGGGDDNASETSANQNTSAAQAGTTPQATFEAYKAASLAKDFQAELMLLTPESQDKKVAGVLSSAVARAPRNPEVAKLLNKHGIDVQQLGIEAPAGPGEVVVPPEQIRALAVSIKDKPGFYAEASEQMEKAEGQATEGPGAEDAAASAEAPKIELINVKIDGDTASAEQRYSIGGNGFTVPIRFNKIEGRWYVQLVE